MAKSRQLKELEKYQASFEDNRLSALWLMGQLEKMFPKEEITPLSNDIAEKLTFRSRFIKEKLHEAETREAERRKSAAGKAAKKYRKRYKKFVKSLLAIRDLSDAEPETNASLDGSIDIVLTHLHNVNMNIMAWNEAGIREKS